MGGALLSSESAYMDVVLFGKCSLSGHADIVLSAKLPLGAIRDRGGQGAAVRVEIVKA